MTISLIAAHDKNLLIGNKGDMPWGKTIKSDLEWFKQHTLNSIVLMGSKTFHSIGKRLPNRINVILTRDKESISYWRSKGCYVVHSIEEFLAVWPRFHNNVFIVGGGELYNQFLPLANRLYITEIDAAFEGDTYFPNYNKDDYIVIHQHEDVDVYRLKFTIFEKK